LVKKICKDKVTFYNKLTDLPDPNELKNEDHQLVIFDDQIAERNQKKIEDYYIYGRKINNNVGCSCIYISQKYFSIPQIVRGQLNYIILLKIRGNIDLSNILRDINIGLPLSDFKMIYKDALDGDEKNFLKIDVAQKDDNKILSKNFDKFYNIQHLLE